MRCTPSRTLPNRLLTDIGRAVRAGPGRQRRVHLVLENDDNAARYLRRGDGPALYDAQWNDDFHHALHILLTGERDGYYAEYAATPVERPITSSAKPTSARRSCWSAA